MAALYAIPTVNGYGVMKFVKIGKIVWGRGNTHAMDYSRLLETPMDAENTA
jgi:hypothetical protein